MRLADAKRNVVRNMHMTGNFTGIGLVESSNNLIEHSGMSGSRFVGVNLAGGAHNGVVANAITASVGLGVLVQTSVNDHGSDNRILDNVIEGNSANDGRGLGINAPNGAVDRGANGASGNGMTPQCVGVACAG